MIVEHLLAAAFGVSTDDPTVKLVYEVLQREGVLHPRLDVIERDKKIVDLRRRGVDMPSIGERFGLTKQRVHQILEVKGPLD